MSQSEADGFVYGQAIQASWNQRYTVGKAS